MQKFGNHTAESRSEGQPQPAVANEHRRVPLEESLVNALDQDPS